MSRPYRLPSLVQQRLETELNTTLDQGRYHFYNAPDTSFGSLSGRWITLYRGQVIYWVKGSVHVLF